ncbi:DNA-directed DNA polymerase II large subunit [Haloarcula pellucida]|uniref:DNA polymerase II large subunit n=1 Tax=Haloarcula pellucida TaxID=1427151 RepID=A0A830GSI8_9EURY|nr:DNA-directed DNA polymerase II large subunit [Halomicroarcula pellucida]MBX0349463.1 DNA-directed DNA polymerase II large subunit [Halomicroarcula pellucida]GGO02818.1 intein-containing DNA polymerase II large subunit [Halomicroarcula pellucida]
MREADEQYFETLETELESAMDVAQRARQRGGDPKPEVEIPTARDMADRVENILGIDGVAERVRELEGQMSREEAALELVDDFVEGTVGDYDTREGKVEGAVRTAVALLTEGVVAAPIEGIDRVELLENDDGTEFINVYYAGPIRSAGGTAQALSVLVADYARALLGIDQYKAREEEIGRYAEEIDLYDKDTGLQYSPKEKETKFIAEHMPIMLDGEATGDEEVSGYRDLERVDSNSARGGMCLVLAEGIALKAPKIQRYTRNLDEVDWPWLQDLIDGTIGKDGEADSKDDGDQSDDASEDADGDDGGDEDSAEQAGPPRVDPAKKYLRDLIAGRPVFSHPSKSGGFRLRYGRARNHGFATAGVHPATMHLVDDFLATGTQIKTERPGKAAGVVPVDTIEGPTVRLANGDVRRIDDAEEALEVRNGVEKILDLGEYLVNYGEFVENNHPLAPASYTVEWWEQDFAAAGADVQAMRDSPTVDLADPSAEEALEWASEYDAPLHPKYTYLWHDVTVDQMGALADAIDEGQVAQTDGARETRPPDASRNGERGASGASRRGSDPRAADGDLVLPRTDDAQAALERLLVEHVQDEDRLVVPDWLPLVRTLGFDRSLEREWTIEDLSDRAKTYGEQEAADAIGYVDDELGDEAGRNAVLAVNEVSPFEIRERAPTRIGNRMGRPEKSERRDLSPAVHTLFPIGEAGGAQRSVADATKHADSMSETPGRVDVEVARRRCPDCGTETHEARCPECDAVAETVYVCPDCEMEVEPDESGRAECGRCETLASPTQYTELDVREIYRDALQSVGERETAFDTLKAVKGLTSEEKLPEPMEKGILRAKHDVSAFKDGTVRYDMTDLPVTAVRPAELDVDPDRLRHLGYETDIHGDPLTHADQLVELKVQDIVLSDGAAEHMLQTAAFVDDLLEQYYGLEPYYEFDDREELVGELVFGMAPHTSAATVGRVVGFTSAAVGYAHPYFHAAKRRNCFHPETKVWYEDEADDWHYGTIEELVESRLDDPETDDFGTLVEELDGDLAVPSLGDDGPCRRPVEAVSRHRAPDHLVRIEVGDRTLRVTPDHTMLRAGESGVKEVRASEIERGDALPAYDGGETTMTGAGATVPVADGAGVPTDAVTAVEYVESDVEFVYCLTVADTHRVAVEGTYVGQCDGDEDCVMLLMDGLLNFSKSYLPNKRGGQMDAPLVMSSRIDPSEIDDEAHNMDIMDRYPREFYEATRELADPAEVEDIMTIAEETLGTDREYTDFRHTHDTTDLAAGPDLSAYKTLGSMEEKMDAQLSLSRKLRAVVESDVAERIIEYHFLPDLIGNLRAFSRQEVRCLDCGESFRRMPLTGDCRECGGRVNLTVHEGSVTKYIDTAIRVADEFGARDYTKQRLKILETKIESVFENDHNKQSGIADFM